MADSTNLKPIIELRNAGQSYYGSEHWILKDTNLVINDKPAQGEFVVVPGM